MKDQTGLVRRQDSGIYYYRARVPAPLVPVLGKSVIFESLKTRDRAHAVALAAAKRYEISQELARLREARSVPVAPLKRLFLSDDEIRAICERYVAASMSRDDDLRRDGMTSFSSDVLGDILRDYHANVTAACARGDASFIEQPFWRS